MASFSVRHIISSSRLLQNERGQRHAEQNETSRESQDLEREDDETTVRCNVHFHLSEEGHVVDVLLRAIG